MDQLLEDLLSNNSNKILKASIELANRGSLAVSSLIELLEQDLSDAKKLIVAGVLANIGEESVEKVINLMKMNNETKLIAALILKDIGKNSVPQLLECLNHESSEVKALTAEILGEINDVRALDKLRELANDSSDEVVIAANEAIKEIEKPFASRVIDSVKYTSQIEKILKNIDK
ncbi:MAG: hypothetical protein DKM50_04585 [Candidatus Margulisiibacteriota bacterium]|nr:MAG: hypothetical protein A2X43_05725 [Candidatus Margulisbacteria bacterium GWD2_39_127]OGI01053.1 MAG: hypothetical protein A2X42_12365 [Candidatus Margulisbacteria bacterium GWF2_38_17]OGI09582.1 MAG: hypothetical protein A2X41_06570 [Candidatus Margulisbacteria bacterium GWE2_39_32]PZM82028.1 MAG: hypothetical protein DKM50_04585 [Candidatus Margulisiibacteriota bacterium]HCY35851.1 hypothetical protein [Candidatus Margulisiibacteriota bacterium]